MKTSMTNKELQDKLKQYPDDAKIEFVPDAQKVLVWYGKDKPDWAVRIEQTSRDVLSIYFAEYNIKKEP